MFRKLEQTRVFEKVADQIRDLILGGVFAPEQKLPTEQELSQELDVSRSSIREALRVLESQELIEVRRGSGTYVAARLFKAGMRAEYNHWLFQHRESLTQLLQVRESIEVLTASLVAALDSEETLQRLEANLNAQLALINDQEPGNDEKNIETLAKLDTEFHLLISAASGNIIAHEILSHIMSPFSQSNKAIIYVRHRQRKMGIEHQAILDAIKAHDPQAVEYAMGAHITRVRSDISETEDNEKAIQNNSQLEKE